MPTYDEAVVECFFQNQTKLFPRAVAATREEARDFLEEAMAVVVDSLGEVWEYFDEEGMDVEGMSEEDILEADEVFAVGDGRYLIVEC